MTTKKKAIGGGAASRRWSTLEVVERNGVRMIGLARPRVHNAFDETLIDELTRAVKAAGTDASVRAVLLHGTGQTFCAGADLAWMKRMAGYGHAENLADAKALAAMLSTLATCPKPTVACVNGDAYGGGVGLIACCDIAIAASDAMFALSEAKLGLIPSTIGPYVVAAIGARQARRWFITGERFPAAEAFRIGLLHDIVPPGELDGRVNELLGALLLAGPEAQREAKLLIRAIGNRPIDAKLIADTAERIARVRATDEAREGIAAFLGKRSPAWVPAALRPAKGKR
ncbi:MAG: enoyl-CoA hydratase/isomerase family protein [Betaproteobacteria bacterium]